MFPTTRLELSFMVRSTTAMNVKITEKIIRNAKTGMEGIPCAKYQKYRHVDTRPKCQYVDFIEKKVSIQNIGYRTKNIDTENIDKVSCIPTSYYSVGTTLCPWCISYTMTVSIKRVEQFKNNFAARI